ncbi:MAG TPA: DUF1992 domain-containing protein [Nocardioidaceae bacterium]|nr:DUF1992 domain-containing protein [Nocardioidaceae bacterium]
MTLEQPDPDVDEPADAQDIDDEATAAKSNAGQRFEQQTLWVDAQIRMAMRRGEFDNLPGAGKPIKDIGDTHDPEWLVKRLVEREKLSGLGPPAILLRKEDAALDDRLDQVSAEPEVRRILEDFNARVVNARRQLLGGPPVVTPTRDIEAEVEAWKARREERRRRRRATPPTPEPDPPRRRSRWWRRTR